MNPLSALRYSRVRQHGFYISPFFEFDFFERYLLFPISKTNGIDLHLTLRYKAFNP